MKFKRILSIGVFLLGISSAFASKVLYEEMGSYITPTYGCASGPLVQPPSLCDIWNTGVQCTVYGYGYSGIEEFPAYVYDRPNAYCAVPLYYQN
jgi:hypothetical protein